MEFYTKEHFREDGTPVLGKDGKVVVREFYRFPLPLLPGRETQSFQEGLVDEGIKKQHAKEYAAYKNPVVVAPEAPAEEASQVVIDAQVEEVKAPEQETVISQTTNPTIEFKEDA